MCRGKGGGGQSVPAQKCERNSTALMSLQPQEYSPGTLWVLYGYFTGTGSLAADSGGLMLDGESGGGADGASKRSVDGVKKAAQNIILGG